MCITDAYVCVRAPSELSNVLYYRAKQGQRLLELVCSGAWEVAHSTWRSGCACRSWQRPLGFLVLAAELSMTSICGVCRASGAQRHSLHAGVTCRHMRCLPCNCRGLIFDPHSWLHAYTPLVRGCCSLHYELRVSSCVAAIPSTIEGGALASVILSGRHG